MEFDRWKDYLQLAALVQEMASERRRQSQQPPLASSSAADANLPAKETIQTDNATPQPSLTRKLASCPAEEDNSFFTQKMDNGNWNYTTKHPFKVPAASILVKKDNTLHIQKTIAAEVRNYFPEPQSTGNLNSHPACETLPKNNTSLEVVDRANKTETDTPELPSPSTHSANANHGEGSKEGSKPDMQCGICPKEQGATENFCKFCKHNGESTRVFTSHTLRNSSGIVICPVLRKYTCPLCGATGDVSHTLKYCPFNDDKGCLYNKSGRNSAGRQVRR
ncbi:uncharacterized protein LOC108705901 [Xenopus laevis]|uniref:Nanos-type domain-containing protein n=2 Tax=Xenopus laevis TaxID=8355 RepID=A0A974DTH3_XENLA|nr:uncharacterized protein LOC108705901 [Xenopus laevis]OCT96741.1 hypothetical protein XELAEV_18008956mg [Xenopus laevis]